MNKSAPIRPGLILKKLYLDNNNISIKQAAEKLNLSYNAVSNIISGKTSITSDIALKLSKLFDTRPEYWIKIQTAYDLWYVEGNRGTDEPFYKLMKLGGEAILKLLGANSPSEYESKAIVLKEKSLYPDIMAVPKNPDKNNERIFIEFQGYSDPMIQYSTAAKVVMSCSQDEYTGPVLISIIYTDGKFLKAVKPLSIQSQSGLSCLNGKFHEVILSEYNEEKLLKIDPRLIILAPFTLPGNIKKQKLVERCNKWKGIAQKAYNNDRNVLDVFSLFILSKFKQLSIMEVRAMLNFDLSDTKAGEELIAIGEERGMKIGKKEGKKEGRNDEKKATAKKMIKEGLNKAMIKKITGLPIKTLNLL